MSVTEDPRREREAAETPPRREPRRSTAQGQKPREQRRESAQPKAKAVASETRGPRTTRDPRRDSTRPRLDVAAAEQPPPERTHVRFAEEPRRSPLPSRPSGKPANDVSRTFEQPRRSLAPPAGMQDALRERLTARTTRASEDPPVDARRFPSQPGQSRAPAPAALGGRPVDCEIDGLAVEIDPAELSIAGLFIESPSPPPLDAEVRVFLSIGALQVETTGHVVKSVSLDAAKRERRRPGYGILFSRLPERTRAALREALEGKPPAAAEAAPRESIRPPESIKPRESIRPRMSFAPQAKQPDPKELEVLARLSAELANLEQQPAWTVLGISQSADAEAARQAFFAASKRYHPHIYARYSHPEIKAVVTQLFIAYKRAFTTMTKTGRGTRGVTAARAARSGNPPGRSSDPGNR